METLSILSLWLCHDLCSTIVELLNLLLFDGFQAIWNFDLWLSFWYISSAKFYIIIFDEMNWRINSCFIDLWMKMSLFFCIKFLVFWEFFLIKFDFNFQFRVLSSLSKLSSFVKSQAGQVFVESESHNLGLKQCCETCRRSVSLLGQRWNE